MNTAQNYRKKPVEIEVIQAIKLERDNVDAACEFAYGNPISMIGRTKVEEWGGMYIRTLEGVMFANFGDYIIKGVKGEVYPCKPDIFDMTYEVVQDD